MTRTRIIAITAVFLVGLIYLWIQYQRGIKTAFLAGSADLKLSEMRFLGQGCVARLVDTESLKYLAAKRKTLSSNSNARLGGLLYKLYIYSSFGRIGNLSVVVCASESPKESYGWTIHYPRGFTEEDGLLYCEIDADAPIKLKECMRFLMDPQNRHKTWPE